MVRNVEVYERQALELIKTNRGILQSDLWKRLGLDSREGSRIVLRLAKKGVIRREEVIVNGRRTYKLFPVNPYEGRKARILVDISSILDLPCTLCPYLDQCGLNHFYNPPSCSMMDSWVFKEGSGDEEFPTPS